MGKSKKTKKESEEIDPRPWFEKESELEAFLNLVNYQGFVLEEAVSEAVSDWHQAAKIHRGDVFDRPERRGGGRAEIDLWVESNDIIFDLESKRSDYDWVFLREAEDKCDVHIISGPDKRVRVTNSVLPKINCVSGVVVEVSENPANFNLTKQSKEGSTPSVAKRSSRDEYVHNAVRQALFNTEILIHEHLKDNSWPTRFPRYFIPVVVTNAKLLSVTYSKKDIDDKACLTKFENITPVPFAAVNHAEILFQRSRFGNPIHHDGGFPAQSSPVKSFDSRFKGTHNKTVFVVNKEKITDFLTIITNKFDLGLD